MEPLCDSWRLRLLERVPDCESDQRQVVRVGENHEDDENQGRLRELSFVGVDLRPQDGRVANSGENGGADVPQTLLVVPEDEGFVDGHRDAQRSDDRHHETGQSLARHQKHVQDGVEHDEHGAKAQHLAERFRHEPVQERLSHVLQVQLQLQNAQQLLRHLEVLPRVDRVFFQLEQLYILRFNLFNKKCADKN